MFGEKFCILTVMLLVNILTALLCSRLKRVFVIRFNSAGTHRAYFCVQLLNVCRICNRNLLQIAWVFLFFNVCGFRFPLSNFIKKQDTDLFLL